MLDPRVWGSLFGKVEPTYVRPIRGIRLFGLTEDGQLTALGGNGYVYKPGLNRARCKRCQRPPGRDCTCGLYCCPGGIEGLLQVVGHGYGYVVLGAIFGYGRFQEHERGWRVEAARIVAICSELPGRIIRGRSGQVLQFMERPAAVDMDELAAIASRYEAPIVELMQLDAIVKGGG